MTQTPITRDTLITGAQFRDVYQNKWPKEAYAEDLPADVEDQVGTFILPDDAQRPLSHFGYVVFERDSADGRYLQGTWVPFHEFYADLMRQATDETPFILVTLRCPEDKLDELNAYLATIGAEAY